MEKNDDSDIKNLNSNIEYSQKAINEVRMKFFKLFIFLLTLILLLLVYFVYREDINAIFHKKKTDESLEQKEEVKKEDLVNKKISAFSDGDIPNNNVEIMRLFNPFYYDLYDYFVIDTTRIYKNDFATLSDIEKLFYISKTDSFRELIDKDGKLDDKGKLCLQKIVIPSTDIDRIAKENFNILNINHMSFTTTYYKDGIFISYLKFTYDNGNYIGTCVDDVSKKVSVIARTISSSAEKKGEYVSIYSKVIFETEKGLYKDINLKTKIDDSYNVDDALEYYKQGSIYKLDFKNDGNGNYYFEKVSLLNSN